jgi:hypothetical protein
MTGIRASTCVVTMTGINMSTITGTAAAAGARPWLRLAKTFYISKDTGRRGKPFWFRARS